MTLKGIIIFHFFLTKSEIITNISKGKSAASCIVFLWSNDSGKCHSLQNKSALSQDFEFFLFKQGNAIETNNQFHFIETTSSIDVLFAH